MTRIRIAGVVLGLACLGVVALGWAPTTNGTAWREIAVRPNLEDQHPDGRPHTPSTQSFLRGAHHLDGVTAAAVTIDNDHATIQLKHPKMDFAVVNLPIEQLVPRLHYTPATPPDAFDALNLMLAEYSRNGLSVPHGRAGDAMAHFETDLTEERPYRINGDYQFQANADFRPIRFAVINNCLKPGLWELSAKDRSGEIYHAWMELAMNDYHDLVARVNGLSRSFVESALQWRDEPVIADLSRLRGEKRSLGKVAARLDLESDSGYSSQDSRRKLAAGFAKIERDGQQTVPKRLADLTTNPALLSNFIAPGKYSLEERRRFDFTFLRGLRGATVLETVASAHYNWRNVKAPPRPAGIEIHLDLGDWVIVLGNLPRALLVPQEDFGIWGFGVGVLPSSGFAERRKYLIEAGPPPTFAYLCKRTDAGLQAVNSHNLGLEQVFIRTHSLGDQPHWEITITSYERIVDLVKYRVDIPNELVKDLQNAATNYAAPLYRTYRDDNVR